MVSITSDWCRAKLNCYIDLTQKIMNSHVDSDASEEFQDFIVLCHMRAMDHIS